MRRVFLAGLFFLCAAVLCVAQPAKAQADAAAFGRLPNVSDVAISPNGTHAIYAVNTVEGVGGYRVVRLDTGETVTAARTDPDQNVRAVGWADDRHAVFYVTVTVRARAVLPRSVRVRGNARHLDYIRAGIVSLETGRQYYVSTDETEYWGQGDLAALTAPIAGDPGYGRLITYNSRHADRRLSVYRVDLTSGRSRLIESGGPDTVDLYLDEYGDLIARADVDRAANRWRIFSYRQGRALAIAEDVSELGAALSIYGLLDDGRLMGIDRVGDRLAAYGIDRASGERALVHRDETYDLHSALRDPWTHRMVGVTWLADSERQLFFDADLQRAANAAAAAMPNALTRLWTWARQRDRFIVHAERLGDAGGFYLFEPARDRMTLLAQSYPEIDAASLGVRQSLTYRARDGTRVPAYLSLPPNTPGRALPLVVLVHGGPATRDTIAFDWWAAFLAARGYAVIQPNFRGSGGYGLAWRNAGRGEWGGLMQRDVDDAVDALARAGIADPARVCIAGGSYGGYAALAGATLTPERYRCAVSVNGVSDLEMMVDDAAARTGEDSAESDWWRLSIGDRRTDRAHLESVSPANLAERVTAPVLLIHGTEDTVVPIEQSRRMAQRLRAAGKQVRLVELSGDDHWLSDAPTRTQMLREIDAFLAQHLGPR